jgi:hypothetical protein
VAPFFGLELLDMARDLADFNLPVRTGDFSASLSRLSLNPKQSGR